MKFVSVRDLQLSPGQVWKRLDREREMIVTSNGKPIALLTRVNEGDFEKTVAAVRRARALTAMEGMQRASLAGSKDKMSDAEIEAEISAARRSRPGASRSPRSPSGPMNRWRMISRFRIP